MNLRARKPNFYESRFPIELPFYASDNIVLFDIHTAFNIQERGVKISEAKRMLRAPTRSLRTAYYIMPLFYTPIFTFLHLYRKISRDLILLYVLYLCMNYIRGKTNSFI